MISQKDLTRYLNELLNCNAFNDYAPNGLQVEGKTTIKKICTAVTASEDAIAKAISQKADALLVHHGFFWKGEEPVIVGIKKQRIAKLLNAELNLYGYHLPLDCHPKLGNNICLAKLFDLEKVEAHDVAKTPGLLWTGSFKSPLLLNDFSKLIDQKLERPPLVIHGGKDEIQTLAWCSGGAQDFIDQAHALDVDAYLSGEISERTYYQAKEFGINYIAAGHHATERYGIQALGEHLSHQFGLKHTFIDSANPV